MGAYLTSSNTLRKTYSLNNFKHVDSRYIFNVASYLQNQLQTQTRIQIFMQSMSMINDERQRRRISVGRREF